MSGYKRIKPWGVGRAWRRSPLTLLQSWRKSSDAPLLFKLHGEHYLLCRHQELNPMIDRETQSEIDARGPSLHATMGRRTCDESIIREVRLGEWLPLLQRFLSVTVTPLLERAEVQSLNPVDFIEAPFTWTLAHHLFGVDVRKAHTERAAQLLKFFSFLEATFDRSESRVNAKISTSIWHQRRLRKLYRAVGSLQGVFSHLSSEVGLHLVCALIEWKRQVTDTVIWLLIYLERQPKIANQIFVELSDHLSARSYQAEDLASLPSLHKVILETLRVAPPHWITHWGEVSAMISEEVSCERFSLLPPQTQLISSPFLDHRESEEWPSPSSFLPHRFLAVAHGAPLPSSYLPLGPGQVGRVRLELVLHTTAAIAATLLRRGHVKIAQSEDDMVRAIPEGEADAFFERNTGASFGKPNLTIHFHTDERYIHIPSARI